MWSRGAAPAAGDNSGLSRAGEAGRASRGHPTVVACRLSKNVIGAARRDVRISPLRGD